MKYAVTNTGRGPRGVWLANGTLVTLARGERRELEVNEDEAATASPSLKFEPLAFTRPEGDTRDVHERALAAQAILDRIATDKGYKFFALKQDAIKVLGDVTPNKQAEVIAALKAVIQAAE